MGPNPGKKTRYQEMKEGIENNFLISILLIVVFIFIGLGAIAGAYSNIRQVLPTRSPLLTPSAPAPVATAPAENIPPTAAAATAIPAGSVGPLDPSLVGDWIGKTNNGGTLRFTLKSASPAGGSINLHASIPLDPSCSAATADFNERAEITYDPNTNRLLLRTNKVELSADAAGSAQNPSLSGQITVFLKDFSGSQICTQPQFSWTAQKMR